MIDENIRDFYCCYLLRSVPKPRSFYIGSTPDPVRRLRQHNGELKRGGAYRTKKLGYRPWKIGLLVYGFPSLVSALQFEHAWQHAYQTRHIAKEFRLSLRKTDGSGRDVHKKTANCKLLLMAPEFIRLGLKVQIFDSELYDAWCFNKHTVNLPDHFLINRQIEDPVIHDGNYHDLKLFKEKLKTHEYALVEKSKEKLFRGGDCGVCSMPVSESPEESVIACFHGSCDAVYHLKCLRTKFLEDEGVESAATLPTRGRCSSCNKVLKWPELAKISQKIRKGQVFTSDNDNENQTQNASEADS